MWRDVPSQLIQWVIRRRLHTSEYVLAVKQNQEKLYENVMDSFGYAAADDWKYVAHDPHRSVEVVNSSLETGVILV